MALFIGMGGYNFGVGLTRKNHDPPCGMRKKIMTPLLKENLPKVLDSKESKVGGWAYFQMIYIEGPRIGIGLKVGRWTYFLIWAYYQGLTVYTFRGISRHF